MRFARGWLLLLSCALIPACSGAQPEDTPKPGPTASGIDVPPPPSATPTPAISASAPGDIASAPLATGGWFQRDDGALFGPPDADPIFLIECDRDNRVLYIDRDGKLDKAGTMAIAIGGAMWRYPVPPTLDDDLPTVEATVPIDDAMLNQLEAASGRIAVRIDQQPWLVMPTHPAIAATIKACRSGN